VKRGVPAAAVAAVLALVGFHVPGGGVRGQPPADAAHRPARLVWHVEDADHRVLDSESADTPVNPASIVKLATSLWALERLGADHRFETRFVVRGSLDGATGVLDGDLLVFGGADPDFHVENAWRVARALNRAGVRTVEGKLLVDERFWIGWDGGSERGDGDALGQGTRMASRLRDAFDPHRWNRATRRLMTAFAMRRDDCDEPDDPPRVVVRGGVGVHAEAAPDVTLLVHRSNPLRRTLKRFNAYSNNDIERLGASLGSARDLADMLTRRWELAPSALSLESLSGLGSNRMTARQVVRLLHELDATCRRMDLELDGILPVVGCDPGTLRNYSDLPDGAVVAKTGTLTRTDGGVAVLAGVARTTAGDRFFCVAAPGAGGRIARARSDEVEWLQRLIERFGGPRPRACAAAVGFSDDDARVEQRLPVTAEE
jgi:D-alanyl-D-alanine carboxypeptidase/D-alanyl-D-alanine-endopeptidase (penicillin-binding protein 4)